MRTTRWMIAMLGLATVGCAARFEPDRTPTAVVRTDPNPVAMTLARNDGTPLDVTTLRGRAVLIIAFVMDDLNGQALLRNAERLARAHPDDLAVIALSGDVHPASQQQALGEAFARVLELQRTQLTVADDAIRDGQTPLGSIEHTPTVFFLNRAGVIVRRLEGYMTTPQLEELVAPALPRR